MINNKRYKGKSNLTIFILVAIVFSIFISHASSVEQEEETVYLKWATSISTAQHQGDFMTHVAVEKYWIENLYNRTNGRYDIKYYPDSQLATTTEEFISGVQMGAFDISFRPTAMLSGYTNAFAELSVPFMYSSHDEVEAILDSGLREEIIQKASADIGVKVLCLYPDGFRNITSGFGPIHKASDLKGKKYRILGDQALMDGFKAMDVAVITVPTEELYTSLQQGLVDGHENVWTSMLTLNLYEVQKYLTKTNHYNTYTFTFMNQDFYDNLSDEDKLIFDEITREAEEYARVRIRTLEGECEEKLISLGLDIYEPTKEELETFIAPMREAGWPVARKVMGEERWNTLIELKEANKVNLDLNN